MTERFMAMLALERASIVSPETLVQTLRRRFPDLTITSAAIEPKAYPGEPSAAYLLDIAGMRFVVMFVDQPTPPGTYDGAARYSLHWPTAANELAKEQAHAIVAAFEPADRLETAVRSANLLSLVAASIAGQTPCLGVYWSTGETVTGAKAFIEASEQIASGRFPIEVWVQIAFLDGGKRIDGAQIL